MRAEALWQEYTAKNGLAGQETPEAWAYGSDDPDRLLALTLSGQKTATASAYPVYIYEGSKPPAVGAFAVITNAEGDARCIIQTTRVDVVPFCEVSAEHAALEGEGDGSLRFWQEVHAHFFSRELQEIGQSFDTRMPVVLERFTVVYKPGAPAMVRDWYAQDSQVAEMEAWHGLKKWEIAAADCFPKGAAILDIGCGLGREAFPLADRGYALTGIDISCQVIARVRVIAAERGYDIPFSDYDGQHLPFADASFDVVILWSQTFGLLYGDALKHALLAECRRVLRPGGWFSFSGHDFRYVSRMHAPFLQGRRFFPYADTAVYWETFLPEELTRFAVEAGLTVHSCGVGEIRVPEDGTVLCCLCRKDREDVH